MKVMLTVYYDEQEEEFTRVVYDPEWLQANPFLRDNTLHDALTSLQTHKYVANAEAEAAMKMPRRVKP